MVAEQLERTVGGRAAGMPTTITVKSADAGVREEREQIARRVIAEFGNRLPEASTHCFFDDVDWQPLREAHGMANRGLFTPVRSGDDGWRMMPEYVLKSLFDELDRPVYQNFIYLHGSACSADIGLTMTFSHELQHLVQRCGSMTLWAANALASQLLTRMLQLPEIRALGIRSWCDVPHECEARIVAKRTAEGFFGKQPVDQYIDSKITERVTDQDADDWRCIRAIDASVPYDLASATTQFYSRLKSQRRNLEHCLRQNIDDPDFKGVNLDMLLNGSSV